MVLVPILLVAQGRGIRVEQAVDKSRSLIRCLIDLVLERAKAINGGSGDSSKEKLQILYHGVFGVGLWASNLSLMIATRSNHAS